MTRRDGTIQQYPSKRQLLIALTGHPQARHWTWDRYFHEGKYQASTQYEDSLTVFEGYLYGEAPMVVGSDPISKIRGPGIDLINRSKEVAKLLFAGYGSYIHSRGYEPEEVLQEVYRGLLVRNAGKCPWDPAKSSFGHYVHMVCGCVLSNYHRRQGRTTSHETSLPIEETNIGSTPAVKENPTEDLTRYLGQLSDPEVKLAIRILPLLNQGYDRTEISERLKTPKASISRAITFLRSATKMWMNR
jgi:hypothetical protein